MKNKIKKNKKFKKNRFQMENKKKILLKIRKKV
jgi:hypothetical protein